MKAVPLPPLFAVQHRSQGRAQGFRQGNGLVGNLPSQNLTFLQRATRTLFERLSPILCTVPDVQDFNNLVGVTVHDNIRRDDQLAGSFDFPRPACSGKRRQLLDAVDNRLSEFLGGVRIILLDVLNSGFKLAGGFGCPPNKPHGSNSRSMRFTTPSWSISSPRSAAAIPFSTPATKRA